MSKREISKTELVVYQMATIFWVGFILMLLASFAVGLSEVLIKGICKL